MAGFMLIVRECLGRSFSVAAIGVQTCAGVLAAIFLTSIVTQMINPMHPVAKLDVARSNLVSISPPYPHPHVMPPIESRAAIRAKQIGQPLSQPMKVDHALLFFNGTMDFSSCFEDWNTKQVFVIILAHYTVPDSAGKPRRHEVALQDYILTDKAGSVFNVSGNKVKYPLNSFTPGELLNNTVEIIVRYHVQFWAGFSYVARCNMPTTLVQLPSRYARELW